MDTYNILLNKYLNNIDPYLDWNKITPIDDSFITDLDKLPKTNTEIIDNIKNKVCLLKLNGGLGTTLGCTGPKSLIEVKDGYNFMDIIIEQNKLLSNVPLVLMNSFYTHGETNRYIDTKEIEDMEIISFNQNKFPRILKETNAPLDYDPDNKDNYYPPGHGDLIQSINDTGTLDKLISKGIDYIFISNSDNLGATLNYEILNDLIEHDIEFALELTPKTVNDVKGGTLIQYDGKYVMFEVAQCHPDKLCDFVSVDKFKYFNTNSIWIKLSAIKELVKTNYLEYIDVIINNKKLKDGRDCIQLEYAIGSLIKFFDKIRCYNVTRNRFVPVKNNGDLDNIRSKYYQLDKENWKLFAVNSI